MKITYENWCKSIIDLDLDGIIFHNNYSETFCETFSNKNIQFIKIEHDPKFNPNVFRYLIYNEFLKTNSERIKMFL